MTAMTEHPLLPEPLGHEPDNDEINLLEYWQILRERQWLVVGVTAAVAMLALVLTLLATPVFRAGSTLQIERDTMQVLEFQGLQPTESPYDIDFYQTQYELLKSRSLAQRVVQDLRLVEHPQFAKTMAAVDEAFNERNAGKANALGKVQAREDALVGTVMGGLTVEPVRNSRLVRVNFDSPD
ncbi:MAG: Wzz/FepE/Etk N-terminal domain-containing protein, partial [Solimonas sp.]